MTKNSRYKAALLESDIKVYQCGQMPSSIEMEEAPKIENWSTDVRRRGAGFVLLVKGDVYQHPNISDGQPIATSAVVWFDRKYRFVRTTNRMYVLGQPTSDNE